MTLDELKTIWEKKNGGKAASTEHALQVACVRWFRLTHTGAIIMAIPNGGYRTRTTAGLMKAEGQLAGVPDLFIPEPRGKYHGLWIEMKNGKAGRLEESQKQMHHLLRDRGYRVEVIRDEIAFKDTVNKYLYPPKE